MMTRNPFIASRSMYVKLSTLASVRWLKAKYRTRPVLEIMNIVETTTSHDSAESSSKRKRDSSSLPQEGCGKDAIDEKPSRKALLAARLKEVEVSSLSGKERQSTDVISDKLRDWQSVQGDKRT